MARLSNEDVADVLAQIANEIVDCTTTVEGCYLADTALTVMALRFMKLALIVTDFVEDQSENFQRLYDNKLEFVKS